MRIFRDADIEPRRSNWDWSYMALCVIDCLVTAGFVVAAFHFIAKFW